MRLDSIALMMLLSASPLLAGEAPAPNVLNGLRRAPLLGMGVKPNEAGKFVVDVVGPNTPAEKAGLTRGDVLVSIDGVAITAPGLFEQGVRKHRAGDQMTVVFARGEESLTRTVTLAAQPLEQQPDFDIDYGVVELNGVKRRSIVTRPKTAGKHPAVLFVGGVGCYATDGMLRGQPPRGSYGRIVYELTKRGYVTMRVEKSGMGDSEGPPCNDPRSDFDTDGRYFAAGLEQLEKLDSVDSRNVFLFAHSIGPLLAAKIAAAHPVRGLMVAETIGTSWLEYDLANTRRQLLLAGQPYDEVDATVRHHELCMHAYYIEKQTPEKILAADAKCADDLRLPAPYTYMQQVGALDLAPLWKKIDAPVLIIYGTSDFVTDSYQHEYLRDMINAFHPGRATYVKIPQMGHGLALHATQQDAMQDKELAPFADQLMTEILSFVEKNTLTA